MLFNTNPKININLSNGCYCLGFDSGTGKSYLKDLLSKVSKSGLSDKSVLVIDCSNDIEHLVQKLDEHWDIILVDRYDLNPDEILNNILLSKKEDSIILIDCKNLNLFDGYVLDIVDLQYTGGTITIDD